MHGPHSIFGPHFFPVEELRNMDRTMVRKDTTIRTLIQIMQNNNIAIPEEYKSKNNNNNIINSDII